MSTDCTAAINATADSVFNELRELSLRIHQNPEIRFQEKKASAWCANLSGSLFVFPFSLLHLYF